MNNRQENDLTKKNRVAWDAHYKRQKAKQSYPDENLVRILTSCKHGSALDIGSGSGRHLRLLLDLGFSSVTGIDTSKEAILLSQEIAPEATCESLEINTDGSLDYFSSPSLPRLDLIVAWGVLHYNEPRIQHKMIEQIYENLNPGGTFTGTLRSDKDTHYISNTDINEAPIHFFSESQALSLLGKKFNDIKLGYIERGPIGNHKKRVCHWVFVCQKNE